VTTSVSKGSRVIALEDNQQGTVRMGNTLSHTYFHALRQEQQSALFQVSEAGLLGSTAPGNQAHSRLTLGGPAICAMLCERMRLQRQSGMFGAGRQHGTVFDAGHRQHR
jgi:hypothetical protein